MSNIYIQEPPTSGKVLLKTSVGDIDIELWCREAPKACRNFIQLCMEGYYNGTIFHRLVKGFIVQGGDPSGDGTGGESIYGAPFKDEFHSRLRFSRRGLVAMANAGRDDNGSQFFFTLGEATELQNKHTIFGKVAGDTVFNMLKLEESVVDHNERPMYPQRIVKAEILLSPFDDIVPRKLAIKEKSDKKEKKKKEKGVKNFGLLSFGIEAEEDEEETNTFVQKNAGKAKSTHDVLDDPKLSKQTQKFMKIEPDDDDNEHFKLNNDDDDNDEDNHKKSEKIKEKIRNKLNVGKASKTKTPVAEPTQPIDVSDSDDDLLGNELERERKANQRKKVTEIREQITTLKKEYQKDRKKKEILVEEQVKEKEITNEVVQQYVSEQQKYSHLKKDLPKKGAQREQHTLELLSKFKNKLETLKEKQNSDTDDDDTDKISTKKPQHESSSRKKSSSHRSKHRRDDQLSRDDDYADIQGDDWLAHKLCFEDAGNILAKDASTKKDDWYDVYDPRNPINKRKRDGAASGGGGGGGGSSTSVGGSGEKYKKSSKYKD